jgi:hypothetical protein
MPPQTTADAQETNGRENRSPKRGRSPGMAGGGPAAAAVVMAVAVASISELVAVTAVTISAVAAVAAAAIPLAVGRRWNGTGLTLSTLRPPSPDCRSKSKTVVSLSWFLGFASRPPPKQPASDGFSSPQN